MGKADNALRNYVSVNERFADMFNASYFDGKQIILPEELTEGSEVYSNEYPQLKFTTGPDGQSVGKEKIISSTRTRDIKKWLRTSRGGICQLRILAIENQENVDYTMGWRNMDYDSLEYGKQIRALRAENESEKKLITKAEKYCGLRKGDRLIPTFTICLYHGIEKWDGPRSLRDMMDFAGDNDWAEHFSDYKMNLLCINEMTDFSNFHSSLRELFTLLAYRSDKVKLKEMLKTNPAFQDMDRDTVETAGILMGAKRFMGKRNKGKETYDMCEALQGIFDDGKSEGITLGRNAGRDEGKDIINELNRRLQADGRINDLLKAIQDKDFQNQLLEEYNLLSH